MAAVHPSEDAAVSDTIPLMVWSARAVEGCGKFAIRHGVASVE